MFSWLTRFSPKLFVFSGIRLLICFRVISPSLVFRISFLISLLFIPFVFFTSSLADGFSLKFEWQQVSSSFQDSLSILAVLNNAIVWIVSSRPSTSKSSRTFNNPLVIVLNAPITIGTSSLSCSTAFSILWSTGTAKSTILQILFFLLNIISSGLLARIRWSVCMLKSHRSLCLSSSRTGAGLCIYHLFVWSNLNFMLISQWIILPTLLCLALYSFCANLLHSLTMWLIISSLSPYSLHTIFCCVLSILALIWLVLMVLSCTAIRRYSVSILRFPFLSQVHFFRCEMLFISRLKRPLLEALQMSAKIDYYCAKTVL